ncbi:unnamed protein product, partial [Staurois parvus]
PPITADRISHLLVSASQCCLSVPVSVSYQSHQSVLPISASQCPYQCPSVPSNSYNQCRLSVPVSATYHYHILYECCLSVPISDACQCPQVMP